MKPTSRTVISLALGLALAVPILLQAAPAPWFQWRSKANGSLVCSQTPLGPGWVKFDGPYRDGRCEKRLPAK